MRPWSLVFNGGLGDFLVVDSTLSQAERAALEVIYWGHPNRSLLQPLLEASQTYRHVRHASDLEARRIDARSLQRWGLHEWFGDPGRMFNRSTFLTDAVAEIDHFGLPENYIVIQSSTPANCPSQRAVRDLDEAEWEAVLERIDRERQVVVVLNGPGGSPAPRHPWIIDLQGQTTLPESLEVLKRAQGFWGIASCLSVLAAQLFDEDHLWIKGPEENLKRYKDRYFAPNRFHPYLYDRIQRNPDL